MRMTGTTGKVYRLREPALASGGEGAIYLVAGMSGLVAKIFHPRCRTVEKRAKLAAMVASHPSPYVLEQTTWPVEVLCEQNGDFAGYVMPRVKGLVPLNRLYAAGAAGVTGRMRVDLAINLCAAVNAVHGMHQVVGDLNPLNILADPANARVVLVDTDSYHVRDAAGALYRCGVGRSEYLAPEVHRALAGGRSLASVRPSPYSRQTDLFALAVHVFSLLMNGCHPFACAAPGLSACPQPVENITLKHYPFSSFTKLIWMEPPRYAPDYTLLPVEIRALFERAFVDGHDDPAARPDAPTWYHELQRLRASRLTCAVCGTRLLSADVPCPVCGCEQKPRVRASRTKCSSR